MNEEIQPNNNSDWLLESILDTVNKNPTISIGITLCVEGAFISGLLISTKEYFDNFLDQMKATPEQKANQENKEDTEFIHLKGARIVSGHSFTPSLNNVGLYWRGRLSSVNGFSLGYLSLQED